MGKFKYRGTPSGGGGGLNVGFSYVHLLPTGSEERGVLTVGSIPVAKLSP